MNSLISQQVSRRTPVEAGNSHSHKLRPEKHSAALLTESDTSRIADSETTHSGARWAHEGEKRFLAVDTPWELGRFSRL